MHKKVAIMVITIPIAVITVAFIVGISAAIFSGKDDGPIEEEMEEIIEHEGEELLGLPDHTFNNLDLTPDSKELGPIATAKIKEAWCQQNCSKEMEE